MKRFILFSFTASIILGLGLSFKEASAQSDPYFSQYYTSPMWLNPGLTGVMDGDYRVAANYRRQGMAVDHPFSTIALSFDIQSKNNLSYGISILNQSAGDAGYHYLNAVGAAAYQAVLDKNE